MLPAKSRLTLAATHGVSIGPTNPAAELAGQSAVVEIPARGGPRRWATERTYLWYLIQTVALRLIFVAGLCLYGPSVLRLVLEFRESHLEKDHSTPVPSSLKRAAVMADEDQTRAAPEPATPR